MDAKCIKVGLVGYGMAGKVFHAPLIGATDGLRLHAVVSGAPAKVHADLPDMRVVPDVASLLADREIDLVIVATPDALHAEHAIAALGAGKHVVVDKPFAATLDDARAITDRAQAAGRMLSVFHNRRWDADFLTLRRSIGEGLLGEIIQFESHFDRLRPTVVDRWREAEGAGVWNDLGPHLVDQALVLFGMPTGVTADLAIQRRGGRSADYAHVTLAYERLRVILHASMSTAETRLRFAVHGSRGSWMKHGLDTQEAASKAGVAPGSAGWGIDPEPAMLTMVEQDGSVSRREITCERGDHGAFYRLLAAALRGEGPNPVSPSQALQVMAVIEAARRSAAEGRTIAM